MDRRLIKGISKAVLQLMPGLNPILFLSFFSAGSSNSIIYTKFSMGSFFLMRMRFVRTWLGFHESSGILGCGQQFALPRAIDSVSLASVM